MKKTKVVHLGGSKFIMLIRENIVVVIFTLIFAFGVLLGSLFFRNGKLLDEAKILAEFFVNSKANSSFFRIFFSSFLFNFIFLFITYLLGTSLIGSAFIPVVMFLRGFFSGLFLCDLYSFGAVNALVINLLTVVPGTVISVIALLCASVKCIGLSYSLCKNSIGEGQSLNKIDIKRYLLSFALFVFLTAFSAVIEAFMSVAFQSFFNFG